MDTFNIKDISKIDMNNTFFHYTAKNNLSTIIKRYKDADSFLDSSYIEEKLLVNLENLLIDNNLLKDYVPYNDLIIEVK